MKYDVVVAGGGPAGVAAAIAAAREGARTLLIEKEACLGGMGTVGGVPAYGPFYDEDLPLVGGIGHEVLHAMMEDDLIPEKAPATRWYAIDSERLKLVLDKMVLESGCEVLLHTYLSDVQKKGEEVVSVECVNKSGKFTVEAKIFIDCTGDGDLAAVAGAEFEYGDEEGRVQAGTLCFKIANFDTDAFLSYAEKSGEDGNLHVAVSKAKKDNAFVPGEVKVCGMSLYADGIATFNFGHVFNIKPLERDGLSKAEMEARALLPELMRFIRDYIPGAECAVLVASGPRIGIRETRRIVGKERVTEEDYYARAKHEDGIAAYNYPIDLHPPIPELREEKEEESVYITSRYNHGESYDVPYGCLLPLHLSNVLVAGRCVSSDRAMNASVRMMPICFGTGQAAGTAAAMCVRERILPENVDISRLRSLLVENKCIIG
ncbi:MAG: FAD-dependent oxidoreductase [Acetatifactor sp.]|nr:FAD-dependent oxidoreductase [Acetatifactor sp.]